MILEDRLLLHDLKGVNLKVDFFLGTREEYHKAVGLSYSVCWKTVDVKVYELTCSNLITDLDFSYTQQQLLIDEHLLSGDLISFHTYQTPEGLTAHCLIALGKEY